MVALNANVLDFRPATESEISRILSNCPNKQSDSYPIWLLKECSSVLIPIQSRISSTPLPFLVSFILFSSNQSPLLKKPTMDKDQLSNYRPISNLSLIISKIIERVVKSRLTDYLSSNNLLNPHQSAYCKHHSTETILLPTSTIISLTQSDHKNILSLPTSACGL